MGTFVENTVDRERHGILDAAGEIALTSALAERVRAGAAVEIEEEYTWTDGARRLMRRVVRVR